MKELKEFTVEQLEEFIDDSENFGSLSIASRDLKALVKIALAAKQDETLNLPLDYQQGHKDGLEWAARTAEACNPLTSDWLYDEPEELAAAIRKGPEMPPLNHTEQDMVVPDGWVSIPKEMLADYRDVKNGEIQTYKASFGSYCDIPRSRWQRDLADLTEELAEIDKLIAAAPKPESE